MLRNYFNIALRNIHKHKVFSCINIFGLAVSMSVCLLIMLIIADQKSYDQFHAKKDRIYRVLTTGRNGNMKTVASSALPLGEKLKKEHGGIEETATLVRDIGGDLFYNEKIASGGGYFANGGLFNIFDFVLSKGNAATALQNPFSLIISEDIAAQLFGNENPLGKVVKFTHTGINPSGMESGNKEVEYGEFTITGVFKIPAGKTHLPFKLLASLSTMPILGKEKKITIESLDDWGNVWSNYTYVLLTKEAEKVNLQTALNQISAEEYKKGSPNEFDFVVQDLANITPADILGNDTSISIPKVVLLILSILGLIIMLSACLNYTNLSVARSLTRAKEVGIRKVSGACRQQLFAQFMTESILISLFALVLAVGLLGLLKTAFSGMWMNKYLNITFDENISIFLIFMAFSIVVGAIAGMLPSLYISAFNPVQVLKNFADMKLFKRLALRKVLLVIQFCISLTFIISATLLYFQLDHLFKADYGFNKDNTVNIKLYKAENYQRLAQVINTNKGILGVSACAFIPATGYQMGTTAYKTHDTKDSIFVSYMDIDSHFIDVWGLKLLAGKNFPENTNTSEQYVIINETMVKNFKYQTPQIAVGQKILLGDKNVEIIGVVKDFHFRMLMEKVGTLVLRNRPEQLGYANVKVSGKNAMAIVAFLENQWKKINPSTKFEYEFLDQQLLGMQSVLNDLAKILGFLAFLAVLVSCLGLLGMATFTAETRTKEIGVRKVLGASVPQIAILLSKSFITLLAIAIVIATPIAYFVNNLWLEFFAYRVGLDAGILGVGILTMLIISLLTVFSQTWRAARSNPVDSLRRE